VAELDPESARYSLLPSGHPQGYQGRQPIAEHTTIHAAVAASVLSRSRVDVPPVVGGRS